MKIQECDTAELAVCRDCWQSVESFDTFNTKIRRIHLESPLIEPNKNEEIDAEEIKTETELESHMVWLEPKVELDENDVLTNRDDTRNSTP